MRLLLISVFALAMTGCASNVITDYDSAAVFGNYSSWNFAPRPNGNDGFLSLDGKRINSAIEREMKLEAMRKVDVSEADLFVTWQIVTEERLERGGSGFGFGLGFGRGNFGWGISTAPPVEKVEEGKLVIELVDTDTKQVVWRAASRRYLNDEQSSEYRRELIDEIVADMFDEYPPGV
ncbi:DUF4136 domain-containing protein [Marinobacter sp. CHS3-4]|uniref:DUF4136 domain-containing protein n=1 Tax=Marinobacter sp. CHS3-4 TaxID=3045174 RepID=UPI0024B537EB|nr:DUF4136 domain-containing protein [Marinobacter sp. CHS3-4]MDI9244794.1 DUF4136 domain-containing protein [Marinobacter sp. CHS3-4]